MVFVEIEATDACSDSGRYAVNMSKVLYTKEISELGVTHLYFGRDHFIESPLSSEKIVDLAEERERVLASRTKLHTDGE